MEYVPIKRIEVTESGELLVTPVENAANAKELYPFIYRTATGVSWNEPKQSFASPVPREWSYFQWFANIVSSAVSELGVRLVVTPSTQWVNVPNDLQNQLEGDTRFAP